MELFTFELKKMLMKRRGLLLITLFFLFRLGSLVLLDSPANRDLELYREDYRFYLSKVEGPVTRDTAAFLDEIFQKIAEAGVELPKLYNSFYDGNLTREELLVQAAPYEERLEHKHGFQLLYDQFIYAREDPERRYLLYDNGWNGLLAKGRLDVMFVSLLLLIITPMLCYEYQCSMDVLNLTTQKGGRRLTMIKLLLAAGVVTILSLLNSTLEYAFYGVRYGLPHGDYPLQSLPCYSGTYKALTLTKAFLWMAASRWFGSLLFAALVLFLSVLIQKYALTLIMSSALLLLPYYAIQNETARCFLPGPLAFLLGTGFLRGAGRAADPLPRQESVLFCEITGEVIILLTGAALFLLAVMLYVIFRRNSAAWNHGRKGGKGRGAVAVLSLLLLINMTGCADGHRSDAGYDIYNAAHRSRFENERYIVWFDETAETLLFEDKGTGRRDRLVRDPLLLSSTIGRCIYGNGRYVYYFRNDYNKSGRYEWIERILLIEVDLETFQERIVYEDVQSSFEQVFLGSGINTLFDAAARQGTQAFLEDVWAFFLSGNTLYLLGNDIRTMDLLTGRMDTIEGPCPVKGSLAFDGQKIYYTTDRLEVAAYDVQTGETGVIPGLITEFFFLTDHRFLYINRADEYRLYVMDRADGTAYPLTDQPVLQFEVEGKSIVYTGRLDRRAYCINEEEADEMSAAESGF